jgi:hypothetical protein
MCVLQTRGDPGNSKAEAPFAIGYRVLGAGPPGEVLGVATPHEAPHVEGAPPAEVLMDILRKSQVDCSP